MAKSEKRYDNSSVSALLVQGAAPEMLMISVATVAGGTAAATLRGNLEVFPATLCLVFALLTQISATYWHFYLKARSYHNSNDMVDAEFARLPKTSVLRESALGVGILAVTVALALMAMDGIWTLVVGSVLAVVLFFTFGGRRPLSDSHWGILSTFLLFGPIGVIGTCLLQSCHEAGSLFNFYDIEPALYISAVMGLMAVNCGLLYGVAHIEVDGVMEKKTIPSLFGIRITRVLFVADGFLWTALYAWLCQVQHLEEWYFYMILPVAVLVSNCMIAARLSVGDRRGLRRLQLYANLNMLVMALAMLVVSLFVGAADDSYMCFI